MTKNVPMELKFRRVAVGGEVYVSATDLALVFSNHRFNLVAAGVNPGDWAVDLCGKLSDALRDTAAKRVLEQQ